MRQNQVQLGRSCPSIAGRLAPVLVGNWQHIHSSNLGCRMFVALGLSSAALESVFQVGASGSFAANLMAGQNEIPRFRNCETQAAAGPLPDCSSARNSGSSGSTFEEPIGCSLDQIVRRVAWFNINGDVDDPHLRRCCFEKQFDRPGFYRTIPNLTRGRPAPISPPPPNPHSFPQA